MGLWRHTGALQFSVCLRWNGDKPSRQRSWQTTVTGSLETITKKMGKHPGIVCDAPDKEETMFRGGFTVCKRYMMEARKNTQPLFFTSLHQIQAGCKWPITVWAQCCIVWYLNVCWWRVFVLICRSLVCAAMLMYDYPLKTDMETVRHLCVCVCV